MSEVTDEIVDRFSSFHETFALNNKNFSKHKIDSLLYNAHFQIVI